MFERWEQRGRKACLVKEEGEQLPCGGNQPCISGWAGGRLEAGAERKGCGQDAGEELVGAGCRGLLSAGQGF